MNTGRLQQLNFDRYVLDLHLLKASNQKRHPRPTRELTFLQLIKAQSNAKGTATQSQQAQRRNCIKEWRAPCFADVREPVRDPYSGWRFQPSRHGAARVIAAAILIVAVQAAANWTFVAQISQNAWIIPVLYAVILLPLPVAFICFGLKRL